MGEGSWRHSSVVKHWPYKHENQSVDSQDPYESQLILACLQFQPWVGGNRYRQSQLASLAKEVQLGDPAIIKSAEK